MAADPRASPYGAASAGQAGASPRSLAISSEASGPAGDEEEEEEDGGVDGDDDDEEDDGAGADEDEEGAVHVPEQAMLRRSLFTGRPSTLCFTRPCGTPRPGDLAPCPVPAETHMRVKSYWKRKAVRMAVRASGAVLLETRHFNLLWGKHMKPPQFKQLLPVQKVRLALSSSPLLVCAHCWGRPQPHLLLDALTLPSAPGKPLSRHVVHRAQGPAVAHDEQGPARERAQL